VDTLEKGTMRKPEPHTQTTSEAGRRMIDEFFTGRNPHCRNGHIRRVSKFEAIVWQLWIKAAGGNSSAR